MGAQSRPVWGTLNKTRDPDATKPAAFGIFKQHSAFKKRWQKTAPAPSQHAGIYDNSNFESEISSLVKKKTRTRFAGGSDGGYGGSTKLG